MVALVSLLGWGLGYFGQSHILARFMAISSPENIPAARAIAVGWSLVTMTGALPWMIATTATRNATDTMMPSRVKNDRNLWAAMDCRATRRASVRDMV